MNDPALFRPPRQRGLLFHTAAGIVLGGACAISFLLGLRATTGVNIVLLFLLSLLLFAPLPLIVYRAYALLRASYRLERDGLRLRWGLRVEDIPLPDVEWIHRSSDLLASLPTPPLSWPGALLGTVKVHGLGSIEYLASTRDTLLLIAARGKIYAISPENPDFFLQTFQQVFEMGSLEPIASASILPAAYAAQIWGDRRARIPIITSFLLTLLLFVGAGLIIPSHETISTGFDPSGLLLPPVPSGQIMLLPLLGAFTFVTDLIIGLFLYRRENYLLVAFLIWGCAVFTEGLYLFAIFQLARVSM